MNRPPTGMSALAARQAAPRRTGPGPFVVLLLFALVPALALFALFRWSDGQVVEETGGAPPPPVVAPPLPPDPLANPVMTFRRVSSTVSRGLNVEQFTTDVVPFLASINDRSCVAISVDGELVGTQNPELAVIPASTEKLIVAAVALDVLGEQHRFETTVSASSLPVEGVIDGDLVLVGGGDPLLTSSWYPTSNLERRPVINATSLDELADRVQAAGVTSVTGAVLGDGSRHDDEYFAPDWGTGVAGLEAGPYDALLVNDARVLGEDQRGADPNAAAAREFARLLADRGIEVAGGSAAGEISSVGGSPVEIAAIESQPLTGVIEEMLRNSDNNTAEMLVKEIGLGASAGGAIGGTRQAGLDIMTSTLVDWGVDVTNVVLSDGSGLSLTNRLTCSALIAVLQRFDPSDAVGSALPVAAESGTLADAFGNHPVAGRLLGKTGTLNNPPFNADPPATKALAGYLPIEGGGAVEYALILNGPTISDQSEYRPVWDSLADVLVTYPSGASPADLGLLR